MIFNPITVPRSRLFLTLTTATTVSIESIPLYFSSFFSPLSYFSSPLSFTKVSAATVETWRLPIQVL
jgi:hypothetical protein